MIDNAVRDAEGEWRVHLGCDGLAQSGRMVIIVTTFPPPLKSQGQGRIVRRNTEIVYLTKDRHLGDTWSIININS